MITMKQKINDVLSLYAIADRQAKELIKLFKFDEDVPMDYLIVDRLSDNRLCLLLTKCEGYEMPIPINEAMYLMEKYGQIELSDFEDIF